MPDSIGEALKIFLEKHLVPTVISVVAAIVALLVLPTDYWMIEKNRKNSVFLSGCRCGFSRYSSPCSFMERYSAPET